MSSPALTLYLIASPTTQCVPVALEELNINYEFKTMSLEKNEQKSEWFLKINPNGRLPALIDHSRGDFAIWESTAILLYVAQHYDLHHEISYDPVREPKLYSEQLQWLFFAHGGIAPMQGQAAHFMRLAPETIPYAIKRYHDETKRLYSVVEKRLEGRDWLVGPRYSLADIKAFTWIRYAQGVEIDLNDYPNIQQWLERIMARPKTYKGLGIPERNDPNGLANMPLEQSRAWGAALFGFKKA